MSKMDRLWSPLPIRTVELSSHEIADVSRGKFRASINNNKTAPGLTGKLRSIVVRIVFSHVEIHRRIRDSQRANTRLLVRTSIRKTAYTSTPETPSTESVVINEILS